MERWYSVCLGPSSKLITPKGRVWGEAWGKSAFFSLPLCLSPLLLLYIARITYSYTHFGHWYPPIFFFFKKKDKQVIRKTMFGFFAAWNSVIYKQFWILLALTIQDSKYKRTFINGKTWRHILVVCHGDLDHIYCHIFSRKMCNRNRECRVHMLDQTLKVWAVPLIIFYGLLLQKWIDLSYMAVGQEFCTSVTLLFLISCVIC